MIEFEHVIKYFSYKKATAWKANVKSHCVHDKNCCGQINKYCLKSVKHILESYYCLPDILVTQVSTNEKCKQLQIACHTCETTQMTENDYHYIMTNHTCGSVLSHAHNVFQKNRFSEQSHFVKIYVHNENMIVARENIVLRK